ncbi:uncharacterized protein LY79DRAFT_577812 [Colletotrichum navitas]|uniref:Uncharacterized protein n=1 Tax=Colletotrichum navitas TaxID=681940 RepID=A0AAD8Q4U1_9PEZI|nr:uncharacterized protein LY79DRAFT_577812 [Colletotrichum navitas]KAK1595875.1 hypothetical protein LY79DRAFT_577812 [Colletotrichum navitas]
MADERRGEEGGKRLRATLRAAVGKAGQDWTGLDSRSAGDVHHVRYMKEVPIKGCSASWWCSVEEEAKKGRFVVSAYSAQEVNCDWIRPALRVRFADTAAAPRVPLQEQTPLCLDTAHVVFVREAGRPRSSVLLALVASGLTATALTVITKKPGNPASKVHHIQDMHLVLEQRRMHRATPPPIQAIRSANQPEQDRGQKER